MIRVLRRQLFRDVMWIVGSCLPLITRAQISQQVLPSPLHQLPIPERPVTAAEEARGLTLYEAIGLTSDDGRQRIAQEQLHTVIQQRSHRWLDSLRGTPVTGMQHDPVGVLWVAAGHNDVAQQQFATRLATPGLSLNDKAYTLLVAVTAFGADARDSARMRIAHRYLAQLDALPESVITKQFDAHGRLGIAYYNVGEPRMAIAELTTALALVSRIPFEQRAWLPKDLIGGGICDYYLMLSDILSGQPNGLARLETLRTQLLAATQASPFLLAKDSMYDFISHLNAEDFNGVLQKTAYLGHKAPMITAHYWWNVTPPLTVPNDTSHSATSKALDDGIIRVFMYGHFGCGPCLSTLPQLDRLRKTVPRNVEVWYVSFGEGMWGATACTPSENAQHLKHYYLKRKGYGFPIALWVGGRHAVADGGTEPDPSPNFDAFAIVNYPTFVVTDGQGIVRHIFEGFSEAHLRDTVNYLVAEAANKVSP